MGAQILIRLEGDQYDDKNLAPFLGRDFQSEITLGRAWEGQSAFLNTEDVKILEAPYFEEFDEPQVKPLDPLRLISVLEKVLKYLKVNMRSLHYEIDVDWERMEKNGLGYKLFSKGSRCWIKGISWCDHIVDNRVRVLNYPGEPNEVDFWLDIAEEVQVDEKKYYLKKTTMFEKHANEIEMVIKFCQHAKNQNERVYWLYEH